MRTAMLLAVLMAFSAPVLAQQQPRQLSAQDLAKLRKSVQNSKARSIEQARQAELQRQEQARQWEEARRAAEARAARQAEEDALADAEFEAERAQKAAEWDRSKRAGERALADSFQRLNDTTSRVQAEQAEYRARQEQAARDAQAEQRQREVDNARDATRRQHEQADRFAEQQRESERARQEAQKAQQAQQAQQQSRSSGLVIESKAPPDPVPVPSLPARNEVAPQPSSDEPIMGFIGATCADARFGAQRWVGTGGTFEVAAERIGSDGWCTVQIHHWKSGAGTASAQ